MPYSPRIMQEKILDLVWSVQLYPPYSPVLGPSDFHLFLSLENALKNQKMFKNFLSLKLTEFYLRGINKLPDK